MIAAVRDMTDREKANQRREQINRLLAVIEFSGEAIISTTLDGVITSWNPAAERLFGYQNQEIIGRSGTALSPHGRTRQATTMLAKVRDGQSVENLETLMVRKDGTTLPVFLTISAIYDQDGAIIGASAMARDMTRARNALRSARSIIESSLASLVAISAQGKITDANQATVKVTGMPREELIGTDFSQYFTDPERANSIYQLLFTEGMALDYPLTVRHRDGSLTEVLYNASVHHDTTGQMVGVFAAARDVAKQVQAQMEIAEQRAKEQMHMVKLERFQQMTIERALKVIELKKEIESLKGSGTTERGENNDQW